MAIIHIHIFQCFSVVPSNFAHGPKFHDIKVQSLDSCATEKSLTCKLSAPENGDSKNHCSVKTYLVSASAQNHNMKWSDILF